MLQQWSDLCDPSLEEALIEVETMRHFGGVALITDRIPNESTILSTGNLLE
ncbi:MAG: transposase [Cyanobacteriota bacterium]